MLDILFPECTVETFEVHKHSLTLTARSSKTAAVCPICQAVSNKVSGYYQRHPHDLPLTDYDARNMASYRLMERLNMRREAHLVHNERFKGEWGSELIYALLRTEWESYNAVP